MVADTLSTIVVGAAVYVVALVILFAVFLVVEPFPQDDDVEEWERRSTEPDELEALRRHPGR